MIFLRFTEVSGHHSQSQPPPKTTIKAPDSSTTLTDSTGAVLAENHGDSSRYSLCRLPVFCSSRAQKALFDSWKMMVHHPDCGVISSFPEFPGVSACHSQSLCRLQWWFWSLRSLAWFSAESRQSSQVSSFPKMMILKLTVNFTKEQTNSALSLH